MYSKYLKRPLDIIVGFTALLALFPIFVLVAIAIKLESDGPVFFKQMRFGKDKRPFKVYKFRTMTTSAPANMPTNSFRGVHSYITRVGRVLRKLSIDELPQLINVLKGDMSLVGPRPVVLTEINLINERAKYDANSLKPGITGWAQVNGRDELDDRIKARMDGEYLRELSFKKDVKCTLKTVTVILSAAGYSEGYKQMQRDEQIN